jgi:hypothetical protein
MTCELRNVSGPETPYDLMGEIRRDCPDCGVEIKINVPCRSTGPTSTRNSNNVQRRDLRRQVLWGACCDSCRKFWNDAIQNATREDPL